MRKMSGSIGGKKRLKKKETFWKARKRPCEIFSLTRSPYYRIFGLLSGESQTIRPCQPQQKIIYCLLCHINIWNAQLSKNDTNTRICRKLKTILPRGTCRGTANQRRYVRSIVHFSCFTLPCKAVSFEWTLIFVPLYFALSNHLLSPLSDRCENTPRIIRSLGIS